MNRKVKIIADDRRTGRSSKLIEEIIKLSERETCKILVMAPSKVRMDLLYSNILRRFSEWSIIQTFGRDNLHLRNGTEIVFLSPFARLQGRRFNTVFFDDLDDLPEDVFQTVMTCIDPSTEVVGVIERPHWLVQSLYQPRENVSVTTVENFEG